MSFLVNFLAPMVLECSKTPETPLPLLQSALWSSWAVYGTLSNFVEVQKFKLTYFRWF